MKLVFGESDIIHRRVDPLKTLFLKLIPVVDIEFHNPLVSPFVTDKHCWWLISALMSLNLGF